MLFKGLSGNILRLTDNLTICTYLSKQKMKKFFKQIELGGLLIT